MRKVPGWAAASILMIGALVAGCRETRTMPPAMPGEDPGKPIFGRIITRCAEAPARLPVVKIRLTDVSPKKLGHDTALYESNADGTGAGDKRLQDIPEPVLKTDNPTRLDIDANAFLKKAGDQLLVEVELADPDVSFVPGKYALTSGNHDGASMFCVRNEIDLKPGDRVARFYVRYLRAEGPRYGKYNLFLLVRDGPYTTPIVIDPKVHNAG
jgi:hypothetical protein